ncbi:serine hydrolase domain-containing protein [Alkalihalobacterium elongatum]|uniref:serine hydrolase domain-containing protein n=1 Tax=Alkalihalobacterium elongatum TaxID=2675466 RepID=UPI001C1F4630|nr:serine hydrolase domain-containing protein [Alkalihalobacterium elongatum]
MKKPIVIMFCFLLLILPLQPNTTTKAVESTPITKENVQAFVEDYFNESIEEFQIPGAVIIVVKDNEILYKQGFGYANLNNDLQVDPDETLFRIGSVTKLFTATAIMQLVEQGLIDLEADVNEYLTHFQIDTRHFQPIRVKHLLTHTPGFDEKIIGMAVEHYSDRQPLRDYLKENQPMVIREPGEYIQYSNYGMGILGLVIEEVSGLSYEQYIEDYILKPLGMNDTYVTMDEAVHDQLAREYFPMGDTFQEEPLYDFQYPSAGSAIATADDMAKFMLLHLNEGTWYDTTILSEKTASLMHERQFSQNPNVQGFGYGFFERLQNSHRFLEHGGNTGGTNSMLIIDKERNLGIFTSNNGFAGALASYKFPFLFINHFYPMSQSAAAMEMSDQPVQEDLKRYEGSYYTNRYSREDVSKITLAMAPPIKVSKATDHSLFVQNYGQERTFIQVEPLIFMDQETEQYLAFEEDGKGNITHLFFSDSFVYEKGSWYQNALLHVILLGLFVMLSVVTGLILIIKMIKKVVKRNKQSVSIEKRQSWYMEAGKLNSMICMSFLLFLVVLVMGLVQMNGIAAVFLELPLAVQFALYIPVITIVLVLTQGITIIFAWLSRSGTFMKRLYHTSVLFLAISVLLVLRYYNMIAIAM